MKKLVKSAKQQFEERLSKLDNIIKCNYDNDIVLYAGNENGNFIILYQSKSGLHLVDFEMPYTDLVNSEDFLSAMVNRYEESGKQIKPFFFWYANGCELKPDAHMLLDIWNTYLGEMYSFEDIYEEIPDFISAKEQWENDSADAVVCYDGLEGVCKFLMDADNLTFFFHSNGENEEYCKYQSVKMSELRKDGEFIAKYFHEVNILHPQDIESAAKWIATGEYTMSDCSFMDVFNALPESTHVIQYKDKYSSPISLTTEQQEALDMIEKAISLFHERGGKLVCYSYDGDWFVVNGNGVTYESTNRQKDYENLIKDGFIDVSEMAEKQPAKIPLDIYWFTDGSLLAKPE